MNQPIGKSISSTTFIGREPQLGALEYWLTQVEQGTGQVVLVTGEAGIGKSRLVAEARIRAEQRGWQIMQGHCFEPDVVFPYAPMIDLLRACLALHPLDTVRELLGPLAAEMVKLLPELTLSVPDLTPTPQLDPEAEKRRLFEALVRFFCNIISGKGNGKNASPPTPHSLLLIIEDLHWSDDTSLEFLRYLARRLATQPLLLLLTYRSDEVHPALQHFLATLSREQRPVELTLPPFSQSEVDAQLRAIFDLQRPVRTEFLHTLCELTNGNPFFIEEVLKVLMTAGAHFSREGVWDRKWIREVRIPYSVQDAVQRRVAQLSEAARHTLTVAAVADQQFDFGVLQAITTWSEAELLAQIRELVSAQLVVEVSPDHFVFRHALTRQAIYSELLGHERQSLHRQIGETLERREAETSAAMHHTVANKQTDSVASPNVGLAYHFYEAAMWEKTLAYARRAGEQAQALYAPRAAIEQFTRALVAAQHLERTTILPSLYRERGLAYETVGEFDLACADLETVLQLAQTAENQQMEWQALLDLGQLWASRDYALTGDYYQKALALARTLDDPSAIAHSLNRIGNWHLNLEEPFKALSHHQAALAIFQELNDRRGLATTFDLLGMTGLVGIDFMQSAQDYKRAIEIFEDLGDRQGLVLSLAGMTGYGADTSVDTPVYATNTLSECISYGELAVKIAREIGWLASESFALGCLGLCFAGQGNYGRAFHTIQHSIVIATEIEHRQWMTAGQRNLGLLYLDLLALPAARNHLEQALAMAHEIESRFWIRVTTSALALVLIQQHELVQAEATLNRLAVNWSAPQTIGVRVFWRARAELELARGQPELALQLVDQLLDSAPHADVYGQGSIPLLAKLRGEILTALRRWAQAEAELQAARQYATLQGARPLLWRIDVSLGKLYHARARYHKAEQCFANARLLIRQLADEVPDIELRDNFVQQANAMMALPRPSTSLRMAKQAHSGLTRREREVAALVATGKSNREIAETLLLGVRTIEGHVSSILGKLGFTSRTEIALWVMENNL